MAKTPKESKKVLKDLNGQLKKLQDQLVVAKQVEGKDDYIAVKTQKDQARFERVTVEGEKDKAIGRFFMIIEITAKKENVFIPLSIASGKKTTGFMYQIEGTGEGSIMNADVTVRGDSVTQITIGTILYAKVPPGTKALFRIQASIRGKLGKTYKIVINRINYKLAVTDARYKQYIKEIPSDSVKFS